ncbi:LAME_0E12002g1_1 [Lachancea meyersii CBS 8951]|uniref:LAME_0E12002g1_1 n=1 Tax=Lachancea meyersii CBS 8951 TaxID=1266667 RepID=A0A1G4JLT5_9SACH|nr:LAME_0E12002g1_1 [Lachancea meyersii CBS 8951]
MPDREPWYVPETVPLHPAVADELKRWKPRDLAALFNDTRAHFTTTLAQTVETDVLSAGGAVERLAAVYGEFQELRERQTALEQRVQDARARYVAASAAMPTVTWENWDQYREGALSAPRLGEVFEEASVALARTSPDSLASLLRALPYILQDPRCVVPDDQHEDLHIAGGRIELTCPITCRRYTQPMVSRKCGHVFDYSGIHQYLHGDASTKDCPMTGCGQKIAMRDMVRDEVMELRCRVDQARTAAATAADAASVPTL